MHLPFYVFCMMYFGLTTGQQCKSAEASVQGKVLKGHTFKTSFVRAPFGCQVLCESELTCQSYNYFFPSKICELNKRTKEARPEDFVMDENRFYMRSWPNRVPLGSIPELPAESCMEIILSEEGKAVSGIYWLNIKELGIIQVYFDFTQGRQGWILIARFSNRDDKHWMNDSGYWWYDRTEAVGETADPSNNADMISPVFWLVSGSEFKVTRSDESQHTPLLQTTGNCLGGRTFRSKVTSYGDFSNGTAWASDTCMGNCTVHYGGQYQTTEGFAHAACSGNIQAADKIGFWCDWDWSSSVIMIGGGGNCSNAAHGIGVTVAKQASFEEESSRPEFDFGNDAWGLHTESYSLNLWIR